MRLGGGLLVTALTVVLATASAVAQQGAAIPQAITPDGIPAQQGCDNLFSPCGGASADRTGSSDNQTWSPDFNEPQDTTGPTNYTFGQTRPMRPSGQLSEPSEYRYPERGVEEGKRIEEPPTEFQLFVAGAIGKMLPLFGSQLFLSVPSTFAPLDKGPVTSNYVVGPGDELLIRAWGSISLNLQERVDRDGSIALPHFGTVRVAGLKASELNSVLTARIGQEFRKFDLSVSLGQLRSIQVLVVGRARRPGSYTVSSLSTLVNVLFASGGPSSAGSMRGIELRRNGNVVTTLDLYRILTEGDESGDAPLLSGDVIYIPPAGPRVALAGSVSQPAIYELHDGDTAAAALALAGGTTSIAAIQRATLERVDPKGERHILEIPLDREGVQTPLINGDVLHVFQLVPRFDNAVILRGNVANPGRYAWRAGMRIRDLIPDKESLVTRDSWSNRNALALTDAERSRAQRIQAASTIEHDRYDRREDQQPSRATQAPGAVSPASQINNEGYATDSDRSAVQPGDVEAERQSDGPTRQNGAPQDAGNSTGRSIAFDAGRPSEDFPRKNRVGLVAPEINWDYAVIERTSTEDLTTTLKPFNLGRVVLEHDDTENFELQPGDVLTIFSQADIRVPQKRQSKLVRLEGEFGAAGVYSVKPGETLRDLVVRAGGFTDQAYLFGSSFTRRSTRLQQQARLDEYVFDLENRIDREAGTKSGSIVNPQGAAVVAASVESQRALVAKLRQMQATGRIVLNILPTSSDVNSIPALPLEDGDVFTVPSRPSSVAVVGAVYDQNSFLFESSERVNHYLQLSGGVAKSGDWKHSFVIRADGSVVSQTSSLARDSHGLQHFELNPGDTLVVPELLNKSTLLRGLTDWSVVFAQFALGAAAVNVIR
jgi:protein involved in polysaccharide export with SLBB domain